jgi:hypothetical protein
MSSDRLAELREETQTIWRQLLFALYKYGTIHYPSSTLDAKSEYFDAEEGAIKFERIVDCLKLIDDKYNISKPYSCNRGNMAIGVTIFKVAMQQAEDLGLVEIEHSKLTLFSAYNFEMSKCILNPKGLEFVLKYQEHDDNERRHKLSLRVSVGLLLLAFLALIINYLRFDAYESHLKVIEAKQLEMSQEINEQKLNLLTKPKEKYKS